MNFVSIVGCDGIVRVYGNRSLDDLMFYVKRDLPSGYSYRIISKELILKIEVMSPDPYVVIFTNLGLLKHSWVIRQVLEVFDNDIVEMESEDDDTEIE